MVVQRRLTDYLGRREDIVDVLKVGKEHYRVVSDLGGGFRVIYVDEPYIAFGGGVSKLYPSDFWELKSFYTSDNRVKICWKYFQPREREGRSFFNAFRELAEKYQGSTNFSIEFQPIYDKQGCDIYDTIINYLEGYDRSDNEIVGGVVTKRIEDKFYLVKALGVIKGVPTHILNHATLSEHIRSCGSKELTKCSIFRMYALNNYVQLYAKAGGMPWTVADRDSDLLNNTLIVGMAASKQDSGYFIGTSFAVAYLGKEVHSYVSASWFSVSELDPFVYKSKGLYISKSAIECMARDVIGRFRHMVNKVIFFQTFPIHESEIEALEASLSGVKSWILVHLKTSGFVKRVYDLLRDDWGAYRGTCVLDVDSIDGLRRGGVMRVMLVSSGKIKVKRPWAKGGDYERNLYRGTPEPLEISIVPSSSDEDPLRLAVLVSRIVLLMGKLDWEAYTNWPKLPFVVKYARRVARALSVMAKHGRKDAVLGIHPLRYIM